MADWIAPLRRVPVRIAADQILFLDMRDPVGRDVLRDSPYDRHPCERIALDALVARGVVPQPDFVKCDVEGAELLVFRGAVRMLDRPDAPIVMFEANLPGARAFGVSIAASMEFLARLQAPGYSFFWVQPQGTLVPVRELRPDVELFNLVAVPASKRERIPVS